MANEKFTLTSHYYASHFQEVSANLFDTGESSDVTLVCDDQLKFKAHKFKRNQQISVPNDSSQCPKCNAVFTQRKSMLKHVRSKHEGVKYPCSQCDYSATTQYHLKTHIKSIHEGVIYPCNQCEYKATQPKNLRRHIKSVHEGVKYPCKQCNYKATFERNLKNHMKSKHNC